jgi:soluble lytic murein transglycosylase-like protein
MRQNLLLVLMVVTAIAAPALDGIVAVNEEGRTIYVDAPRPNPSFSSPKVSRASVLVYWSRVESRWKPVPAPSLSAMRAARSAAAEVSRQVASAPARPDVVAEPEGTPDNREILRGRAMSSAELDSIIDSAAQRHNVDPNLVRAVVKVESNFNPRAVSRKGAMGLMQLMPATARNLNVSNPFDPQQNVDAGVRHLRQLLDSFQGDVSRSLAAYNAGSTAVVRNNGVPPYAETRQYVQRITELYGGKGSDSGVARAPIHMYRDSSGVLTITNTE